MGVPKWLQSIANATIRASIADAPTVTTASGYTINSKTGEVTQDATEDPGVKQLRDNLAVLGGIATGITATPVVGAVVSNPVAQKLIGDAAASMLGGEVVDKTHKALTGQSFGRGVANIFGQQNVYDRSALARFGYDALNPGYFAGNLVAKGTNAAIDAAGSALKNADNYITIQNALRTGKLRFGEPTTYTGIHQSKIPLTKVQFPFQRWDVTTHGADPNGFWLTLADSPNTTGTMASRPYASRWSATSQKPLIQTGEVKSILGKKNNARNAIVKYGRKHGADAFEFRRIKDNALPQTNVVMVTEGTNPQYLGGVGQVRYAGPTTGKSTFIKANPDSELVDLDAVHGYKQLRKDIAEQLGLDWKSPKVTDSPEYQQAFNDFIRDWAQNTENTGKTLFGSAKGLLRGDNPLAGKPFIPDFETFVTRNQARGFKENPEQLRAWYNSIVDSYPGIKIDNRFIGEIPLPYNMPKTSVKSIQMEEPIMGPGRPKKSSTEAPISPEAWNEMLFEDLVGEQGAINAARKASQAGKRVLKPITEAEKLGIPKSSRSDPRALEDPYYWGYKQWNQRYNDALNKGDYQEVQRIRDLHFKVKAPDTKVVDENGMPLHVYHGQRSGKHFNQFIFGWNEEPTIINPVEYESLGRDIISRSYADGTVQTWKPGEPEPPELRNAHIVRKRQFIPSSDSAPPAYHTSIKDHALSSYTNKDKVVFDDYLNIENPFSYDQETLFQWMSPKYDWVKKNPPSGMRQHWYRDTNGNLVIERVPNTKPTYEGIADWAFFGGKTRKTAMEHGHDGLFIPQYYNSYLPLNSASQIKSARSVTYDDIGNIIPIVKRDNFHNLDRRYKQGGKIKTIF